jgi:ELWxxDGT repeat protein
MVKDILPGSSDSSPSDLAAVGSSLYFRAYDVTNGTELWKSDGTEVGTVMVKDIQPGSPSSSPSNLTAVGSKLFFGADDGANGNELWWLGAAQVAPQTPSSPVSAAPSPAAYSGPIIMSVSNSQIANSAGKSLTISGQRLSGTSSLTVDGKDLIIVSKSDSMIEVILPELSPGSKNIILVSSSGVLTHQDAFVVMLEQEPREDRKVNAGSFKGYVAIYALGFEGQRLSAKVGNDWVIVPAVPGAINNLYRHVEFTGVGYQIQVRLFIDRVLLKTVPLLTK